MTDASLDLEAQFVPIVGGRFMSRHGAAGSDAVRSEKKVCFVATDRAFLIELLYGLSLRADCCSVKYSAFARDNMHLGRCFLTSDAAAARLCAEYKTHPKLMVSIQDDDFFNQYRETDLAGTRSEAVEDTAGGSKRAEPSRHVASIQWTHTGGDFARGRYSREHTWSFDGGLTVQASPSPSIVRPPYANPAAVDPEEAFVAAVASCHMLTFLHLAGRRGYEVAAYRDDAVGEMTKNERGVPWVSAVVLSPRIEYRGDRQPSRDEARKLHEEAHEGCFIANSVKTQISVT